MTNMEVLPESIPRRLSEIPSALRAWLRARDGDSRAEYQFGLHDLRLAEAYLKDIQEELARDHRGLKLQLTMGGVAVPAFYLSKDTYDFTRVRYARDALEPGSTLDIRHFFTVKRQYLEGDDPFLPEIDLLYSGSVVAHVGSESIGKTLAEGGKLEIVPKEAESLASE